MTIGGWFLFAFALVSAILITGAVVGLAENTATKVITAIVCTLAVFGTFFGLRWYFQNTASGQRAMADQKSNLNNGMERTVTVYTANGDVIAEYSGRIDIEGNDGGYVLFDYDGHRYTYYNCFVESIADLE